MARSRPFGGPSVAAFVLVSAACGGGIDVRTDYDPGVDYSAFGTFAWAERTPSGDDDPRVYNRVTMQRVRTAVERALRAKGYTMVEAAPDFYVGWHGAIEGRMSTRTINSHYGYGWGWYGGGMGMSDTYVTEWDEGTLLVDIVDAASNELVWRGTATGTIEETRTPEEAQSGLDWAARELLRDFPPGARES